MTKYLLNETPVRTSNNYGINDILLELELPNSYNNHDFEIENYNVYQTDENIDSKIGLKFLNAKKLIVDIPDNTILNKTINITYKFNDTDNLIDIIEINLGSNSKSDIVIKYESMTKSHNFHYLKQIVNSKNNSISNISILNLLNDNSESLISFENIIGNNSDITHNFIDIGGKTKISNYYSEIYDNSKNTLNNIYIGKNKDVLDLNYHMKNIGKNSISKIEVQGTLDDYSKKNFKGTIDFIEGCTKSHGEELENCILLSEKAKSKSLPMLLCHEEDVEGAHGVSTGKIDNNKLFYIMSRGIDSKEATKLIIKSNFNRIINNINNEITKEEISKVIEDRI